MAYSPEDIVGKHLHAVSRVPIRKLPWDNAPEVGEFKKGDYVGQVYAFLVPKPGRSVLYWMFLDSYGQAFYTPHKKGLYNEASLRNQGIVTDEEKETTRQPQWYQLSKNLITSAIVGYGIFGLAKALINRKTSN